MSIRGFLLRHAVTPLFVGFALLACGSSSSGDGATCVATPVNGAPCDPAVPACHPGGACGISWSCDSTSHEWLESGSNCVIEPGGGTSGDAGDAALIGDH